LIIAADWWEWLQQQQLLFKVVDLSWVFECALRGFEVLSEL